MIHEWVRSINSYSDRWMNWMLISVIEATVVLAFVSLIWLALRRRVSPNVGYILFLLVPLKLMLPISVTVPARFAYWARPGVSAELLDVSSPLDSIPKRAVSLSERVEIDSGPGELPPSAQADTAPAAPVVQAKHAVEVAQPQAPTSRDLPRRSAWLHLPRLAVIAMTLWLLGVMVLLGRFVGSQIRFARLVRRLPLATESSLTGLVSELQGRVGIRQPVRVIVSEQITIPAVTGLFRPTLLLPSRIETTLSAEQLEWVLLHELAHIRRRDLLVVAVQRCTAILYCFNPAVWLANRVIHALREYACDDWAVVLSEGTAIDSSEALLAVWRQANGTSPTFGGALGVFGLDARSSCTQRLKRLLDTERTIQIGMNHLTVCGLVLLAALILPRLYAADEAAPKAKPESEVSDSRAGSLAKDAGQFALRVVGPDGKPVPNASIEIRTSPAIAADDVLNGRFVRKANYGNMFSTDARGELTVKVSAAPGRLNVGIMTPGFGPYWAEWTSENDSQQIPAQFTAELEGAWTAGGIVVDPDGHPVEGATVKPNIDFKKRPGDAQQFGIGTSLTTGKDGVWRFDMVPASYQSLHLEINHRNFRPLRQKLARDGLEVRPDQPLKQTALDLGLTVRGTVTDSAGDPIEGALIRTKFLNDIREARTDKGGEYLLSGCEETLARIVVSAKGKATDMQEVRLNADVEPVNFVMQAGGKIRVRVVDDQDRPIPKSRIFFQRWRGQMFQYFEFDHVNQYCNDEGAWEWNEAPLDFFEADICPPVGMQLSRQKLAPRDEEYVFKPPKALVITGRVVDAVTKQPIKKFDVLPGVKFDNGKPHWSHKERFSASNGRFQLQHDDGRQAYLVRIEASGYRTVSSRDIQFSEGKTQLDLELVKGHDVVVTVVSPDGSPAADAQIALGIPGAQINLQNGEISDISTFCEILTTSATGQLRFPQQDQPYHLIAVHPTGCLHFKAEADTATVKIELQAWGRIEGTYRRGSKPTGDALLSIDQVGPNIHEPRGANIMTGYRTVTGADGTYKFDRVWPGRGWIGREIIMMVGTGAIEVTSTSKLPISVEPGEAYHVDFGGIGRPVVGKLAEPGQAKVDWKQLLMQVEPRRAVLPPLDAIPVPQDVAKDLKRRVAWIREWQQTEPGKAWLALQAAHQAQDQARQTSPYYRATLTDKGEFRIDNLPEGEYTLSILFGQGSHNFTVPASTGDQTEEELDLGMLDLQ